MIKNILIIGLLIFSTYCQAKEQEKRYSSYIECIKDQTVKINTFRELYVATHGQYEINEINKLAAKEEVKSLKYCLQFRKKLFHF